MLQCLDDLGVLAQQRLHEPHAVLCRLAVAFLAREDDHIALISLVHHELQGNRIGKTSVKQKPSAHFDGLGNHRHGCRGADPLKEIIIHMVQSLIDTVSRVHVKTNRIALHGRVLECIVIKYVVMPGNLMVSEPCIVVVAGFQQRPHAAVTAVLGKAHVVTQGASCLS